MQIGKVICTYRKKKGLTQEEMANRLGVTTPAVNKWENGVSYPDIMLLAPIARLLDISLDTLLSFREELTTEEIQNIVYEVDSMLKEKPYEEAFEWAREKLEEYPNCEMLILEVAVILNAWRMRDEVTDTDENGASNQDKYESTISQWFKSALESDNEEVRTMAADSLFIFYLNKEDYDKAEEYLTYFSNQNPERKWKQALIYSKTDRTNEAYKTYEEVLFSMYQMSSKLLQSIYMLALKENNLEKAHAMVEKQSELARVFEMGEYYEISCKLELATVEKDVDAVIDIMKRMLVSIDEIYSFTKAPVYEHMSFREAREEFSAQLKEDLLQSFRDENTFGFLKDDGRWKELIK
ncbi:MAG: helix-turn-helix transcriptional regulator [Lachnospiraceae bacterium]|nr:helix-turn-helix transcriptional regulator [Lachnospiraceae bacterium]